MLFGHGGKEKVGEEAKQQIDRHAQCNHAGGVVACGHNGRGRTQSDPHKGDYLTRINVVFHGLLLQYNLGVLQSAQNEGQPEVDESPEGIRNNSHNNGVLFQEEIRNNIHSTGVLVPEWRGLWLFNGFQKASGFEFLGGVVHDGCLVSM